MAHSIKERLAAGKLVRIFAIGPLAIPKLIEAVGRTGEYHGVWIDQEHAALTQTEIEPLTLACRASGLDSYIRLAPTDYATVMRPLETGAGGIMAAQIRSLEQAKQVVSWAKFPPIGQRGLNLSNYEGDWGTANMAELVERANRLRWVSLQIETVEALESVEAIAKIPGVDHLFVGPADLSVALGVPGQFLHAKCIAALERISRASSAAGISWGILPRGLEHAKLCRKLGCQLFAFALDLAIVNAGLRSTRADYEEFFVGE